MSHSFKKFCSSTPLPVFKNDRGKGLGSVVDLGFDGGRGTKIGKSLFFDD